MVKIRLKLRKQGTWKIFARKLFRKEKKTIKEIWVKLNEMKSKQSR